MKNKCPVCNSKKIYNAFKLEKIPYSVNILYDTEEQANSSGGGTQDICICERCGFVFNRAFDETNIKYNLDYHGRSIVSDYYKNYLNASLESINSVTPLKGKRILEVGSNTGDLMNMARKFKPSRYIGVDPNADEAATETDGRVIIRREYFGDDYLLKHPEHTDVIISIHVVEHLENPLELLNLFFRALEEGGILYIDTPRLDWILENRVFFDFSYEHCSYFTDSFMKRMLKSAGFSAVRMDSAYEGQFFSIVARKSGKPGGIETAKPEEIDKLKYELNETQKEYYKALEKLKSKEPLYLWGVSGKGVVCANILDKSKVLGFIDISPYKQGKYIPGTSYKVLSPSELNFDKVKNIAVLNDVYLDEIKREVEKIDSRINVCSFNNILSR